MFNFLRNRRSIKELMLEIDRFQTALGIASTDARDTAAELKHAREEHVQVLQDLEKKWDDAMKAAADKLSQVRAAAARDLEISRNVSWSKPARRISASDVKRAFAVPMEAPLWTALHQEIDDFLQELINDVSLPPTPVFTEHNRLHLAGGIEQVRELQKRLLDRQAHANKADEDIEAAEK